MIAPLPPPVKKALHTVGRIAPRPGIPDGRARIGWIDKEGNHVKDQISQRTLRIARYLLKNGGTVRSCAARFSLSKTTVHKDLRERLPRLSPALAGQVEALLSRNKAQRHLRGGEATRLKYQRLKAQLPNRPECAILKKKP